MASEGPPAKKKKKMSVWEQPVSDLVEAGALGVPPAQKERVLRVYGGQSFNDFDAEWRLNEKLGGMFPSSFQTMVYCMNVLAEEDNPEACMREQFDKLGRGDDISSRMMKDMFNLVQSCVRTRLGERVWYV